MGPRLDGRGDGLCLGARILLRQMLQWGRGLMAAVTGSPLLMAPLIGGCFNGAAA